MGPENLFLIAFDGILTTFAAILYAAGGTSPFSKTVRRIGSSACLSVAVLGTALIVHRWAWQYLGVPVILSVGFSLGYGAKTVPMKIFKRIYCALAIMGASAFGLWAVGFSVSGWVVFGLTLWVGMASVVLGVVNPFNNAPLEQFFVCMVLNMFLIAWPFVR